MTPEETYDEIIKREPTWKDVEVKWDEERENYIKVVKHFKRNGKQVIAAFTFNIESEYLDWIPLAIDQMRIRVDDEFSKQFEKSLDKGQ